MPHDVAHQACLERGLPANHLLERSLDLVHGLVLADNPGDTDVDRPGEDQRIGHA
jgi:hypothetical protein